MNFMIANKYKIYRNKHKNAKLNSLCNSAASVWNHVVMLNKRYYKMFGESPSKKRVRQQISKLRKNNPYWLQLNSQTVQEVVDRVFDSYNRFFKKLSKRTPKLKKWRDFKSFVFTQSGWSINNNKLTINKVVTVKFSKSRDYEDIRNIRVKRDSTGDWWLIILSSKSLENKKYSKTHSGATVGFDFSLPKFLVGSDGTEYNSPLFYKQYNNDIKKLNRSLSKKKKGSKNRTKCRKHLTKIYRDVSFKRANHHWELAHKLCKKYDFIYLETLNLDEMKKLWGKKISDLSLSSFTQILRYVAPKYETVVHHIDKWYPSSKTCSSCGAVNKELKLSDREWTCTICGAIHDRDKNASKNILRQGIVEYSSKCKSTHSVATCGDGKESN